MEKYRKLSKEFEEAEAKYMEEMTTGFKEALTELFRAHPHLIGIVWTQYTPFFNDGEPCVFTVNDSIVSFDPAFKGDVETFHELTESYKNTFESYMSKYYLDKGEIPENFARTANEVSEFFNVFNNSDIFRNLFGDHVMVVATPTKIEVSEYEHD